jgi:hypothetical protein
MRTTIRVAVLSALLLAVAACGGDDAGSDEGDAAQPAPDVSTFEQGGFDDLPRHPRSEELGERTEAEGTVSQSFKVTGATPEQVLQFYNDALGPLGWLPLSDGDIDVSEQVARDQWVREGTLLVVSASEAPTLEDEGNEAVTQYSLSLGPQEDT